MIFIVACLLLVLLGCWASVVVLKEVLDRADVQSVERRSGD